MTPMEVAATQEAILYNLPAVAVLAWMMWRRPVLGAVLLIFVWGRVVQQSIPFSMHACIAGAAVAALPRWERLIGVALSAFTGWWVFQLGDVPDDFWPGLWIGLAAGLVSIVVRQFLDGSLLPEGDGAGRR